MKVVVLGCGPAGLLSAHAAQSAGADVQVISQRVKSEIGGAQYLHRAIPGLTLDTPQDICSVYKDGTDRGYARKVYGDPDAPTSWDEMEVGSHGVWNMRQTYDILWAHWNRHIIPVEVGPHSMMRFQDEYDIVVSTVPLPAICRDQHEFHSQEVAIDYGPADTEVCLIEYNGSETIPWYRRSVLFGWRGVEYPPYRVPVGVNTTRFRKPLRNSCDCWPGILRAGRYGKWEKGVLIHHAYEEVTDAVQRLFKDC